ncbi:MAG: response regulator [bacterium]|nr:response regulator [bacterium]
MWMLAEDEADIRNLLSMMITVWGHQTVAYENGQKVWEWLDTLEQQMSSVDSLPELVLMDIRMPGKKGNEIANRMRSIPAFSQVPIVLMTAFSLSDGERTQMMSDDGVDHILSKPLPDLDQLRSILYTIRDQKRNGNAS